MLGPFVEILKRRAHGKLYFSLGRKDASIFLKSSAVVLPNKNEVKYFVTAWFF